MKVLLNIIKFIIITVLVICSIAMGILNIVSSTILEKEYIISKLEETNFYEETYELVKSNFENYIDQSGLDETVLNDICTKEKIKNDINIIVSNLYEGKDVNIDTTEIAQNLNNNIDNLKIKNTRNSKAIEQFVEQICKEYTETILHTKYENKVNQIYKESKETIHLVYTACLMGIVISGLLVLVINFKKVSKDLQDIGITALATSAFNIIACKIVTSKINIEGIKIFNDIFSKAIVIIIKDVISKIKMLGFIELLIGMVLIIIYSIIVFAKSKNEQTKEKATEE